MYNQSYDDYIRSVLGYQDSDFRDDFYDYNYTSLSNNNYDRLDDLYPDIYKIVYPMVQRRCQNLDAPITRENIDMITEELYSNIENGRNQGEVNNSESQETRQFNGGGISDIIKILLIRELLGRSRRPCNRPGCRPPFPPPPGRPPFYRDIYEY